MPGTIAAADPGGSGKLERYWASTIDYIEAQLGGGEHPPNNLDPWGALFSADQSLTAASAVLRDATAEQPPLTAEQSRALAAARARVRELIPSLPQRDQMNLSKLVRDSVHAPQRVLKWMFDQLDDNPTTPLVQLSDGRPDQWVTLDSMNLHQHLAYHRTGLGCWVALTVPAFVEQAQEWTTLSVHQVPAFVADIVTIQHRSDEAAASDRHDADSAETLTTALRLWSNNRERATPLASWPAAVAAARLVTT